MALIRSLFLCLAVSSAALAADLGTVITAEGQVTYDGQKVKKGFVIAVPGRLSTGKDSRARVLLTAKKTIATLNENSIIEIAATDPVTQKTVFQLAQGTTRWVVQEKAASEEIKIMTRSSVMGVRGTDFIAIYTPLFGESEIVCFDGFVNFQSAADKTDHKMIKKGQWGGIGGRYGAKIGDLIDLPAPILETLSKSIPTK